MKFVPEDAIVSEKGSNVRVSINSVPELITPTATLTKEIADFYNDSLFLTNRYQITPGLKDAILAFHWPFSVNHQSYYRANKLREKLNSLFPDLACPFVDPDYPLGYDKTGGGVSITIGFDEEKGFSVEVGHPDGSPRLSSCSSDASARVPVKPVPSIWYFKDDADKIQGPFTVPALQKASHFKECLVRREGEIDWVLKSSISELNDVQYTLVTPGYRELKARRQQKAIVKNNVLVALSPIDREPAQVARTDFADDPVPKVVFKKKVFCFSGDFISGTRQKCIDAVFSRGGTVESHPNISTDYMVIGTMANPEWANGNYGRKIERALELRLTYKRPAIITENTFTKAVYESEPPPKS